MKDLQREREERLLLALDATGLSFWDWDITADRVTWSGRLDERFGRVSDSPNQSYESFFKMVHPDDRKIVAQAVKRSLEERADYEVEFRLITTDGEVRWISGKGKVIFDRDGRPTRMIGTEQDITEYKQMEQMLQERDEDMRALMNSTRDIVSIIDLNGIILEINEYAAKVLGRSPEELLGKNAFHYHPPEVAAYKMFHLDKATQNAQTYHFENENNGLFFSHTLYPVKNAQGETTRIVVVARDITERKQLEQMLIQEMDKAKKLLDIAEVMILALDTEGLVTLVNKKACEILSCRKEEIIGKDWIETYIPERIRGELKASFKKLVSGDLEPVEYLENPILTSRGEERIVAWHNSAIRNEMGRIIGTLSPGEDITDQKRAEEALRQSEARFKGIFESSPIGIEFYGPDGRLIHVNRACMDIFGVVDIEKVAGFSLFDGPNLPADAKEALLSSETVRYETAFDFEKVKDLGLYKTSKSGFIYICVIVSPLFLEGSKSPSNYLVQVQDITERKAAEEHLIALESKFSAAFQISPDPLAITDIASGEIIDINRSYEEATGFSRDELIGRSTKELNIWADPEERGDILRLLFNRNEVRDYPIKMRMKKGDIRDMLFSARFITIGDRCYLLSQAHDITEKKKLEEELKRYSEQLEVLVEERTDQLKKAERLAAIGETAAMIGHDLRNPLQAVYCMIYLAKERLNSGRMVPTEGQIGLEDILDSIEESADYMNKIVSDIQDYARTMGLNLVKTDISFFIREALSTIQIPDNVHATISVEEDLYEISIDPEKMKRIIINLVTNALNAMPEGGSISISVSKKDDLVKISVKDTGVGIPEEILPKLFLPLFTTRSKGVGLGLSVCKRMVDAMEGNISINSRVGEGTEAIIEIPMR